SKYSVTPTDINKLLTVYGTGYYLEDNDSTQADIRTSSVGTLNITTDGVTISGITADTIKINANNVIVERCLILEHLAVGDEVAVVDAAIVRQCFIEGSASHLVKVDNATNLIFSNNFVNNTDIAASNNFVMELGTTALILNNLFFGEADNIFRNASVANNYFEKSEIDGVNSSNIIVKGNYAEVVFLEAYQGLGFANSFAPDTMFRPPVGSRDKRYGLRPLVSPGLNAGIDGKDIGIFGGSYPYVPSGMPPIPSIWFYEQHDTAPENGTIDVQIKSKSHK
ncbi:MAG: hypothetical protein ACPGWM_10190, partial [Flavobacteriales bacterium]